jgi:membrane protease YdiL (CAAX protease family)
MENHSVTGLENADKGRAAIIPMAWFAAALMPMVASQIMRLHQSEAANWIFWDYAGRIGALAILAAIPASRAVAFQWCKRQMSLREIAVWILVIVLADRIGRWVRYFINAAFPVTVFGAYPRPSGWLYLLDLGFGLALVAFSEEIIFRRCARHVLQPYLGDGEFALVATSLAFGCYHWWAGLGNVFAATMIGILLMLMLKRSAALWPVVLAHYLVDVVAFS